MTQYKCSERPLLFKAMLTTTTFWNGHFSSAQQELTHRLTVLREQATQLGLNHERYQETSRLNEAAGAEVESLLRKMEQRTKVCLDAFNFPLSLSLSLSLVVQRHNQKDLGVTHRIVLSRRMFTQSCNCLP